MGKELEQKDRLIASLQSKMAKIKPDNKKPEKKIEQLMFKINLCCFESIDQSVITFVSNNVKFMGKITI